MPKTIKELISISGGKNWDKFGQDFSKMEIFDNVRHFIHLEDFYQIPTGKGNQKLPKDIDIDFCAKNCGDGPCDNQKGWTGIDDTFNRFECWYPKFKGNTIFALGVLFLDDKFTQFPAKHWINGQHGDNLQEVEENFYQLARILDKYFPSCTHVEMNEYWMKRNKDDYQAVMRGLVRGCERIKVLSTSVQATDPNIGGELYENHADLLLTQWEIDNTDGDTIHPYGFLAGEQSGRPESLADIPENLFLTQIRDMKKWKALMNYDKPLFITETGINSGATGEQKQADYLVRKVLLTAIEGLDGITLYEAIDMPEDPLFNSTGLLNHDLSEKQSYRQIKHLLQTYGDYYYKSHTENGDNWECVLTNGSNDVKFNWNTREDGILIGDGSEKPNPPVVVTPPSDAIRQASDEFYLELASNSLTVELEDDPSQIAAQIIAIAKQIEKQHSK